MQRLDTVRVGAVCAILTTVSFVAGIALMVGSGVQELIPGTGDDAIEWIKDVDDASGAFFAGAWLVILGGVVGLVALVGFYYALREAGELMILAPVLSIVGLTLVTISHLIPIARRTSSSRTSSTRPVPRARRSRRQPRRSPRPALPSTTSAT